MSARVMELGRGLARGVERRRISVGAHAGRPWAQPSLLELYREDATSLRRTVEREAAARRSRMLFEVFARLFR